MVEFKGFLNKRIEVLNILKETPLNKNQVCFKTAMSYATILNIFKELISNGLIERVFLETDTRQHRYKLTEKGISFLNLLK